MVKYNEEIDTSCCDIPRQELCDLVDKLPIQYQQACNFHNLFLVPFLNQANCFLNSIENSCKTYDCSDLKGQALTDYGISVGFPRDQCNANCLNDDLIKDDELYCRLIKSHLIGLQGSTIENLCCALIELFGEDAFIITSSHGLTQVSSGRPLDCFELNYISLIQEALPKTCGTTMEIYDIEDMSSIAGINCSEDCENFDNDWCDDSFGLCEPITCDDFTCECVALRANADGKSCITFLDTQTSWGEITSIKVATLAINSVGTPTRYLATVEGSSDIPICIKINGLIINIPPFSDSYSFESDIGITEYLELLDCIIALSDFEFYINICPCPPDCSSLPSDIDCETEFPFVVDVVGADTIEVTFGTGNYVFDPVTNEISGEGVNTIATVVATNSSGSCEFDMNIIGCIPDCSIFPNSINCNDLPFNIEVPNANTTTVTITGSDYSYVNGQVVANVVGVGSTETITIIGSNDNGFTCSKGIIINECVSVVTPDCSVLPSSINCDDLPFVLNIPNANSYSVSFSGTDYSFNSLTNEISGVGGNETVTIVAINGTESCSVDVDIIECSNTNSCSGSLGCTGESAFSGNPSSTWYGTGSVPNSVPADALGACSGDISGVMIDTAIEQGGSVIYLNITGTIPASWDSLTYAGASFPPPQIIGIIDLSGQGSLTGTITIPVSSTNLTSSEWASVLGGFHDITATCS